MFAFLLALLFLSPTLGQQGCIISPFTDLQAFEQPLIFWGDSDDLVYPPLSSDWSVGITLDPGDVIAIACVGGNLTGNIKFGSNTAYAICDSNSELRVEGQVLQFNSINCDFESFELGTVSRTNFPCGETGERFDVLLEVNLQYYTYIPLIEVCFDSESQNVLYVHNNLTKYIRFKREYIFGSLTEDDGINNLSVPLDYLYYSWLQRENINSQLGLPADSTKYINEYDGFTIDAITVADTQYYIYDAQQLAALRYINSVPIWNPISVSNWDNTIWSVFNHVANNPTDLEIFTGTYGISTLPHEETGESVNLYLYLGANGEKLIPIPSVIWRILYDPIEKSGLALVTVNNPYQVKSEDIICEDISSNITWLSWDNTNVTLGYSYACTYDDLKKRVPYVPDLDVIQILS